MRRMVLAVLVLTAAAAALSLGACDLVAGDSLVVGAARTDPGVTSTTGAVSTAYSQVDGVVLTGVAGIAPCDYRRLAAADFDKWQPKRVSLAFSGNTGTTPCMRDQSGRTLTGSAFLRHYRDDLTALTRYFASRGAATIFSAPVCVDPALNVMNGSPLLRSMERELAASLSRAGLHVAYSEYAALQICPSWTYRADYRAVDGIHLSPTGATIFAAALRREIKTTRIP